MTLDAAPDAAYAHGALVTALCIALFLSLALALVVCGAAGMGSRAEEAREDEEVTWW